MQLSFSRVGLRAHAILISVGLIALTALLGVRAYSVGRANVLESRELLEKDVPAQKLLFEIEASQAGVAQARKKLWITKDPAYLRLIAQARGALELARRELGAIQPGLDSSADVKTLEQQVASERESRARHARDVALGLERLIGIALGLSLLITAWLILLLYRGLMDPLRALGQATHKIHAGDLSARIGEHGVAELRELGRSFNSMATRLESLDHAKHEFLALISHELRNPMAALKEGLALLSAEEKNLSEEARKRCLSACVIASKRLSHMINNLLSLSRAEPGAFHFELSRNNLSSAILSSVAEVRPIAEKKGMQISVRCPPELSFAFNREGMVQAFVNLLLNAIKYGAENTLIDIGVEEPSADSPMVRISVSNAGKEIPSRELDRVFEVFYRGENSAKQQGMGIGLHVVKRVVDAHRGFVSALSEAGRTRMIVTLPLLLLLCLATSFTGCSAPAPKPAKIPASPPLASSVSISPAHPRPFAPSAALRASITSRRIARRLRRSKGDQVLVSRKLLERLLRDEKAEEAECSRVSGQFEALKRVDVDGPHAFAHSFDR